jgi:hypothetical protein
MLLWLAFVFFNPYSAVNPAPDTLLIVFIMVTLASTGLAASLWDRPWLLFLAGLASFVPVGFYILGTPSVFRWIGALNLMTVSGALLCLVDRRQRRSA